MHDWPVFLGGSAKPTGCSLSFIERPAEQVLDEMLNWPPAADERLREGETLTVEPAQLIATGHGVCVTASIAHCSWSI